MKRSDPKLDPGAIGISFVDILFALAIGQVLDPIKNWGENPHATPLSLPVWTQLAVVLVLILTSWVGYHGSVNRPRFRLAFFNWELAKFVLDVSMVVVYFIAAAIAARPVPTLRIEALLVMLAFALYGLWDLAGAAQKAGSKRTDSNNRHKAEWAKVQADKNRPDVIEEWRPTNWARIAITFVCLVITVGVFVGTLKIGSLHHPTRLEVVVTDTVLIVVLIGYRLAKDHVPSGDPPGGVVDASPPSSRPQLDRLR